MAPNRLGHVFRGQGSLVAENLSLLSAYNKVHLHIVLYRCRQKWLERGSCGRAASGRLVAAPAADEGSRARMCACRQ